MNRWRDLLAPAVALLVVAVLVILLRPCRAHVAEPPGLHTDDEIRRLAPYDIDAATAAARSILDMPHLMVVPAGSIRPRVEVFRDLGLDEKRLRDFRASHEGRVVFLRWQVSPSYDVVCMTGDNDGGRIDGPPLSYDHPARGVYGIRVVKRGVRADIP
jgi:hypothetical protein